MQLDINDPLYVAYNWIGPRGPIWNTELPNIMSVAGVTAGAETSSRFYWADTTYYKLFVHTGNHPIVPAFGIQNFDAFVYPFSIVWRVEFSQYFLNGNGILEYGHTLDHIKHQVTHCNGFFLLDDSAEAHVRDEHLRSIHSYFGKHNEIPMGKIIYVTGCMNIKELYDRWCEKNGIKDDPMERMIMVPFPTSQHAVTLHLADAPEATYDTDKLPEKLFLCWNRRFRPHRTHLAIALDKAGLIDRSYYSMNMYDPEIGTSSSFIDTVDVQSNYRLELTQEDVNRYVNKLPTIIDGEKEITRMCGDFDRAARDFYSNSLVSIVTETVFDSVEVTATEKTWKPVKEKHPFILVGAPGSLRTLREFGIKTFSEFWDESYDEIDDPSYRLYKIVEVCKHIGSWSNDQILDFKRRVKPILEHNYQIVKTDSAKLAADQMRVEINKRLRDKP